MTDVTFARPLFLALVAVPVILLGVWYLGLMLNRRRGGRLSRRQPSPGPLFTPLLLAACASIALFAAAQPRWGTQVSAIPRNGAELIIVLDVSRSMDVRDVQPSRMDATKAALNRTLDRLGGDRVGLVVFAGSARLRMPLTTDLEAARQVIQSLQTAPVLVDAGTDASSGLEVALSGFDLTRDTGRVILLITDGDDLGGDPAADLARLRDAKIDLLVAGAGTTEGGTVPVFDVRANESSVKLDAAGQPIISRLNEPFLQLIAAAGGGRYLGSDLSALPGAVQGKLQARQSLTIEERESEFPIERFQLFAVAALVLLLVATLLSRLVVRAARKTVLTGAALVAMAVLPGCASEAHTLNGQGQDAMEAGDPARAAELFLEAQANEPSNPSISLNLALAYHANGQFEDARQASRRVLLSNDNKLRATALSVIGHAEFAENDLVASLDAFKRSLLLEPGDANVRHDYEVVWRLLNPPNEEEQQQGEGGESQQGNDPSATPGAGEQPGQPGQPNQQGQQPGQPQPGQQPGQQGGEGDPSTPLELQQEIRRLDGQISRLLEEAGDAPSTAQAIEILELLAERARIAAQRDAFLGSPNPRDY